MKFQILHESRGRVRLRAMQRSMSMRDADLLEAWILALPGVDQVTVHERICGVTSAIRRVCVKSQLVSSARMRVRSPCV